MRHNLEDLIKLDSLLKKGIITENEFNKEKDKILEGSANQNADNLFGLNENTYCFLIHISVLLEFIHVKYSIYSNGRTESKHWESMEIPIINTVF